MREATAMRRYGGLSLSLAPPFILAWVAQIGLWFDSADAHGYFGMMLYAVIHLLACIVMYLHKLMYGEDGNDDG